jgi:hypothetical protein
MSLTRHLCHESNRQVCRTSSPESRHTRCVPFRRRRHHQEGREERRRQRRVMTRSGATPGLTTQVVRRAETTTKNSRVISHQRSVHQEAGLTARVVPLEARELDEPTCCDETPRPRVPFACRKRERSSQPSSRRLFSAYQKVSTNPSSLDIGSYGDRVDARSCRPRPRTEVPGEPLVLKNDEADTKRVDVGHESLCPAVVKDCSDRPSRVERIGGEHFACEVLDEASVSSRGWSRDVCEMFGIGPVRQSCHPRSSHEKG